MVSEQEIKERLAHNIRKARLKKNMTLDRLSQKTAISIGALFKMEKQKTSLRAINLYYIAQALGVSMDSLFEEEKEEEEDEQHRGIGMHYCANCEHLLDRQNGCRIGAGYEETF